MRAPDSPAPLPRRRLLVWLGLGTLAVIAGCGGSSKQQAQQRPASCPARRPAGRRSRGGASYAR